MKRPQSKKVKKVPLWVVLLHRGHHASLDQQEVLVGKTEKGMRR
jgi:hypothetical protein